MQTWEGDLLLPSDYTPSNYIYMTSYLWKISDGRGILSRASFNTSNNKLHVIFLTVGNWQDNASTYTGTLIALFYKKNYNA